MTSNSHPDDIAIESFSAAMKGKMAASRAKGRSGWQHCLEDYLTDMLRGHIDKGDMRDVALISMMIWHNRAHNSGDRTKSPSQGVELLRIAGDNLAIDVDDNRREA